MEQASWLDLAIAPLTWLERSRGWKRRGLALLYLGIALAVSALGWRELSLWRLPKAPEPFDVARLGRLEIPDSENAMVAYRATFARLGESTTKGYDIDRKAWDVTDWSAADPEVRRWADDHRADLLAWLPATDRCESLLVQPEAMGMGTLVGPAQMLRELGRLALLEGSRLQQAGDLEGAWRMDRAALRASRHAGMHGGAIQRLIGNSLLKLARPRVEGWAEDPRLTSGQLRRAIADVEACAAMTSPASEMVRAEYFSARAALGEPRLWSTADDFGPYSSAEWTNHVGVIRWSRHFLRREEERAGRVLRLVVAGYLTQSDRPSSVRARLRFPEFMIYDYDARTPPAVRSISPEELDGWAKDSAMKAIGFFSSQIQGLIDSEPGTFEGFRVRMAERAYQLDHGKPPRTYGDLLGPYLQALPEGLEPGDPTAAGSIPSGP